MINQLFMKCSCITVKVSCLPLSSNTNTNTSSNAIIAYLHQDSDASFDINNIEAENPPVASLRKRNSVKVRGYKPPALKASLSQKVRSLLPHKHRIHAAWEGSFDHFPWQVCLHNNRIRIVRREANVLTLPQF